MITNHIVSKTLIETLDFQIVSGIEQAITKFFFYPLSLMRGIIPLPWHVKHIWFFKLTNSIVGLFFHKLLLLLNYPLILLCIVFSFFITKNEEFEYIVHDVFGEQYTLYNFNYFFIVDLYFCVSSDENEEVLCFSSLQSLLSLSE
ncbi:MAG: hypothetical protein KDH96_00600 [Candidatus Riesia sp.]|nr:hypothetical protein [Candidatus Riesia sp.]